MLMRIFTLFNARNREFFRDRSAFIWNIVFPLVIIFGFGIMFSGKEQKLYKVGVVKGNDFSAIVEGYKSIQYTEFIEFDDQDEAVSKLLHHKLDLVLIPDDMSYLISESSAKGYVSEKLLFYSQLQGEAGKALLKKKSVEGRDIPYVEWLFPGILGMNVMFSALYGVGFVIVRYRKNGVLKRFSVTPLRPAEFLAAQILSRIIIILGTTVFLFTTVMVIYRFDFKGNFLDLLILFVLGAAAMVSIGFLIAGRSSSEEFTDGILNLLTWPMMFFSEVWFSLEGANEWVRLASRFLPLTYIVDGARRIMNDGASLYELRFYLLALALIMVVCMSVGSLLFKWEAR